MNSGLSCLNSFMVGSPDTLAIDTQLLVGAAKVEITPPGETFIAGYGMNRVSTGIHDPVWARSVVLDVEGRRLAILSLDLVGLFLDEVEAIRQGAASEVLLGEDIIVCCTHNHEGPDTLGLWGPEPGVSGVDPEYRLSLRKMAIECIRRADADLTQARLLVGATRVDGVAKNGRDKDILDPVLVAINAEDLQGRSISTIVNFANHPEALGSKNTLISADWPNYLYGAVEDRLGGTCLLLNGALGGMVTPDVTDNSHDEARRIGETTGDGVLKCLESAEVMKVQDLTHLSTSVLIPLQNEGFLKLRQAGIINRQFSGGRVETELHLVRFGDLEMVTVPGEALPKVGLEIRRLMKARFKIIVGLGNDELGYIIPEEDFDASRYEESMSVGPKAAPTILKALAALLKGRRGPGKGLWAVPAALLHTSGPKGKVPPTRGE